MRDLQLRDYIDHRIDTFRDWWNELMPEQRPPGFDIEGVFKYVAEHTLIPEVVYRLDQLLWFEESSFSDNTAKCACLPYRKDPKKAVTLWNSLKLGFKVYEPAGTRKAWKIVCDFRDLDSLLRRFDLESRIELAKTLADDVTKVSYRTGNGKRYRPYPSEEAAKGAVERVLLKIGLVLPLRNVEEMHEMTGYNS